MTTYKAGFKCLNCDAQYNYDVQEGTSVHDYAKTVTCKNCKCMKLDPAMRTFEE